MGCSDKDSVATDPVHVDTGSGLNVIKVDIAVLCNQVNHIILGSDLGKKTEDITNTEHL